ncbi:uncharacterized protein K02A2.6-like [Strongylocentrotus purpuratus]|uniref:Endonuclease n=2 Tax=Strongylocentrotus purpuratus TaxID=7668 RepID=A0A7M7PP57_STRPU|nr:uncharacterized protein K02A2.6-like [Strongylocentrotus purpuratus]
MAEAQLPFHIAPPPPLRHKEDRVEEWKMFKQMYENYEVITKLKQQDSEYQRAVFLHTVGPEGLKIFNAITFERDGDDKKVDVIIQKMNSVIIGQTNEIYERFIFNKRDQKQGESIEAYVTELKQLAKTCKFCDCLRESLIRDRIVLGIADTATRKILLQRKDLKLETAIDICRSSEVTASQMQVIGDDPSIHRVEKSHERKQWTKSPRRQPEGENLIKCKFCGNTHRRKKEECPAYGKMCKKCGKENHFAICCKKGSKYKKEIHNVESEDSAENQTESETESVNHIEIEVYATGTKPSKGLFAEMLVENRPANFQIDSGASVNVISKSLVPSAEDIVKENIILKMYNRSRLQAEGRAKVVLRNTKNNKKYRVNFIVVKENLVPLLSGPAAQQMKFITVHYENFNQVCAVSPENILESFSDIFDEQTPGKLPGKVKLVTREEVTPTQCNAKPVPVAMKQRVKDGLAKLVDQDILIKVEEPTPWCSRLVVIEKKDKNELRFCIDPRPLNKALQREIHRLPVMEDILPELSKAKIFSKFDLRSGYLHCELDDESSFLTTMNTPFGRYRWKRLPFGLNASAEIFQKKLQQALDGLDGIECVADDIILFGVGDNREQAEKDHDRKLEALLQRCRDKGIKLNQKKSVLKATSIPFLGHIVTDKGLKVDPEKVKAILEMPNPSDPTEVQRLQGSVNYLARFLPMLSDMFEPLRRLTHKDADWEWTSEHERAMSRVKESLTRAPVLAYYSPDLPLTIQCDASKSGLGAVLLQKGQPLSYVSRALTATEQRYAQIEKEALAICFALERFHQYTFGQRVIVESDHKPLQAIVKKPLHKAPRRLQGMLMRMLHYDIDITWVKGQDMHLADMLSRAYLPTTVGATEFGEVNIVETLSMGEERVKQLQSHTNNDEVLQTVKKVIHKGWPEQKAEVPEAAKSYFNIRDELSVQDGLVFRGERVVIPITLRKEMKETLHTSHLGIEGTLRRAREIIYWPGMNADVKQFIQTCEACRMYEQQNQKETLMPHDIPDRPWEKVGTDLFELNKKHYLVTVDYLSNFWEIDRLYDLGSRAVIGKLKSHFARYGIPSTVISDNGPQYSSEDFAKFSKRWQFDHVTISPRHSQANGKVEAAVKAAKRLLKKTSQSKGDAYLAMLELRNTPNQGVDSSPAQRLHGRRTRTLLPTSSSLLKPRGAEVLSEDRKKLKMLQRKQSERYNLHAKDLPTLVEGDIVRLKPYKSGSTVWQRAVVNRRLDERSYEVETDSGLLLRRNRVDLKRTEEPPPNTEEDQQKTISEKPQPQPRAHGTERKEAYLPSNTVMTKHPQSTQNHVKENKPQRTQNTRTEQVDKNDTQSFLKTRSGRVSKPPQRFGDYVDK